MHRTHHGKWFRLAVFCTGLTAPGYPLHRLRALGNRFKIGLIPPVESTMSNPGRAINRSCAIGLVGALIAAVSAFPAVAPAAAELPAETKTHSESMTLPRADPIAPGEVVAVPPALLQRLQKEVLAPTRSRERRLDLLVQLLFAPKGVALEYDGTRTRTIDEAFIEHKANCLTFSLLFVALARQAGIDAYVQETDHVLAWQGNGALYGNGHVNVGVKVGPGRKTVDIDRSVVSIRGAPQVISDERALAHFYNNRGAELMEQGRLQSARMHLDAAIRMDPTFVGAWNNLGVLHMREGALKEAEHAYATALDHKKRYSPTLSNMVNLYRHMGDAKRLSIYEKRLFDVQRRDPFHQIILALGYERSGDYTAAIDHFKRAIRLKAKDHFVYFGLARSYARLGDTRRAVDALVHARDAAGDQRNMYQTKLEQLRQLHAGTR